MKKLFLIVLTVSIFALLGSIGFGCGDAGISAPGAPGSTEVISDLYDRAGCILLEITMNNGDKFSYWVISYYEENGLLHLYNQHGFLISIDCSQIHDITETNFCNTNK